MFGTILSQYGIDESEYSVKPFGDGLINHTWKIIAAGHEFLLQRINTQVFKNPENILDNCRLLSAYFREHHPDYLFVAPLFNHKNQNYVVDVEHNYFRLFPFIQNSFTCNTVSDPVLAYEAAKQFGKFTRLLSGFKAEKLKLTLPDFHNLQLRLEQFFAAMQSADPERISNAADGISFLQGQLEIVDRYNETKQNNKIPFRVIHHDAKINNVLFDQGTHQGSCLIDLDTVMPGYFYSDVGDMFRTYLPAVSEEEADFSKIAIRTDYFKEIVRGYLEEMQAELTATEKEHFVFAGKFAIYMQALRFMADYLNNDNYYGTKYPGQNLVRANNQIELLKSYLEKENELAAILNTFIK